VSDSARAPGAEFKSVAIIGLGLIGASIAAAIRRHRSQKADEVFISAFDQDATSLEKGLALGLIDQAASSIEEAVESADLVVIAVPVLAFKPVLSSLRHLFNQPGVVLTDVGSVKGIVVSEIEACSGEPVKNFIPGHPIAGSEKHGVAANNPDLFAHHKVILTPLASSNKDDLERVKTLWQQFGADVVLMSVEHHDLVLAQTSHLPHLLAFALIDTLSVQGNSLEVFDYAAGGLRDFSRIAASDPTMWRDVFESNKAPLLEVLSRYQAELEDLKSLIENNQLAEVHQLLQRAKSARDHFSSILEARQK